MQTRPLQRRAGRGDRGADRSIPIRCCCSVTPRLTGNSHRIHYDADYVRDTEENYPGLIVHGPLQATWLAALAGDRAAAF